MLAVRHSEERGKANFGWLDSRHSFSFGHYHDPDHMGFGPLRVINEDRVKPAQGFDTHGHREMEIISYVLQGELLHKDSMGNGSVIRTGDVQRMTAGTGIRHSEFNASDEADVHFLQIWILPEAQGLQPGYEQKAFTREDKLNQLRLVGSQDGRDGSVVIHQAVDLYAALLEPGQSVTHSFGPDRKGWLQLAAGSISVDGQILSAGDGLALSNPDRIQIKGSEESEVLLFDMQ